MHPKYPFGYATAGAQVSIIEEGVPEKTFPDTEVKPSKSFKKFT